MPPETAAVVRAQLAVLFILAAGGVGAFASRAPILIHGADRSAPCALALVAAFSLRAAAVFSVVFVLTPAPAAGPHEPARERAP
ncbi:MAG TPA: hypothetical protein VD995_00510 [Azospirillum sp.]|nr:hypothetical protein [Azospirillum sp.]